MAEYIERERLKEAFIADLQKLQTLDEHTMDLILIEIEEAPAANVAEVRHGRWVDKTNISRSAVEQRVDCSVCGQIFWTTAVLSFNYCPNCGALMDKEDEHEAD